MKPSITNWAPLALSVALVAAMPAARAAVVLGAGTDRSVCPDPTFDACYVGVDGARSATAVGASSFSFVGLGVVASEIGGVAFPVGGTPSMPQGTLSVGAGASVLVLGDGSQGVNSSVTVGNGNGSRGTLIVDGGTVTAPIVLAGQTDLRTSTGTIVVTNGGSVTSTVDASATATLGSIGVGIGRSEGSRGVVSVIGAGSTFTTTGASVSMGRLGVGSIDVAGGGRFASAGSLYASTASPLGTSTITVSGAGSTLSTGPGGRVLLGIASDTSSGTPLNQGFLPNSPSHGTATLDVRDGGTVSGDVVMGAGGTLRGDGTVTGDVANYGGTIRPGNSPGTLRVGGNFLMDGGLYLVEVAGPDLTDLIDIGGSATLSNATVLFSFIGGFAPSAGFTFDFLRAAQGLTFSNLTFQTQGLLPGFVFDTSTADGSFVFTARSQGLAVPEPQTLALLVAGLLCAGAVCRRGRAR